ncbi:sugar ABC transporter ATP-binding protein [Siculibacillus lacustris]|uniref:Sugar ABC transporter ATP-binding protein n=1 Tax=Siculibacillus lacustris TaxID=1549641 RepID=A0A4Q9VWN6_9HYPH|nr:ATP-binding cassette domain-containing protein [Siculibacillus lacustris]TBW39515.1 sugar ABC transporter ATP-binding protein [Siculibacillus lacustris]
MADTAPFLSLTGVTKSYGPVEALKGVDLDVHAGDVLALVGDNGAGKSSLVKILAGAHPPSGGEIRLKGEPVHFASPGDALQKGIATIYQDLAVAPRLSITENIFLGSELTRTIPGLPGLHLLDKRRMRREAGALLTRLSVNVADADTPVERLSGGQRQAVALSRALRWDARMIIMDEPTAALGVQETRLVLDLIRRLHAEGRTVVLISHNMADVCAVATRVAVLKGGRKVIDRGIDGVDADRLAHMVMTGREG